MITRDHDHGEILIGSFAREREREREREERETERDREKERANAVLKAGYLLYVGSCPRTGIRADRGSIGIRGTGRGRKRGGDFEV